MEQSAVEWLEDNLISEPWAEQHFKHNSECWDKAKEMEKKQIMDAYEQGYRDGETNSNTMNYGIDISKFADAKIYYNQTFKSE
jgi:hypothetical protein